MTRRFVKTQVDELESATISTALLDGVQSNLRAISSSLTQISGAQKDLKGDRKLQGLATSYQTTLGPIDCSS
jgi:hypothetical protein